MVGYCSNGSGSGKVNSDGGGKSKGSAAATAGYRVDSSGGKEDIRKGNSSENGEPGCNNGGIASHLSLIVFFCWAQDTVMGFVFLLDI